MLFHGICERAGSVDSSNGNIKTVHTNCFVQRLMHPHANGLREQWHHWIRPGYWSS